MISRHLLDYRDIGFWLLRGKPLPPPPAFKRRVVRKLGRKFSLGTFIETGTYQGDMVDSARRWFSKTITVELDQSLAANARRRFTDDPSVTVLQGDSSTVLDQILREHRTASLFWLDAHYSGGVTARGLRDTPIEGELSTVLAAANPDSVILIDDARLFGEHDEYPSLTDLETRVRKESDNWHMHVSDDVIFLIPKNKE